MLFASPDTEADFDSSGSCTGFLACGAGSVVHVCADYASTYFLQCFGAALVAEFFVQPQPRLASVARGLSDNRFFIFTLVVAGEAGVADQTI